MHRVFGDQDFEHLTAEARQLADQATGHESDLSALVELLASRSPGGDLLVRIRQLCVDARELRLRAARHIELLTGEGIRHIDRHPRPRVLVVDDEQDIREVLAMALTAAGLEAITAADGLEALIAAHTGRPAVILMDLNMPVLNGIDATRLLKARAGTRRARVIAHTAKADSLAEPIARLFEQVVTKPAMPSEIVAVVRAYLSDQPQPDASGQL
jgi:CheY-like chemotaxis protein